MKSALPNWICAVCLIIIAINVTAWSLYMAIWVGQFAQMERKWQADEAKELESAVLPYKPQPTQRSSEWGN